jgi:hypothetical protein
MPCHAMSSHVISSHAMACHLPASSERRLDSVSESVGMAGGKRPPRFVLDFKRTERWATCGAVAFEPARAVAIGRSLRREGSRSPLGSVSCSTCSAPVSHFTCIMQIAVEISAHYQSYAVVVSAGWLVACMIVLLAAACVWNVLFYL